MNMFRPEIMVFVFLIFGSIALFSFLSIKIYVDGRRKERESYYKSETMRRLTETQGAGAAAAIELLREEESIQTRRRLEGLKLGGLVTTALGIGMMVFLYTADGSHDGTFIGIIPLLVGLALLAYVYALSGKSAQHA
jgi:hypothetical protein